MTTHFPLSGPMSVGDLLDRAFCLYRARFGVFLLTAAIFFVAWEIISRLVLEEFLTDLSNSDDLEYRYVSASFRDLAASATLIVLKTLTAYGFVTLALTVQCGQALHGSTLTAGQSIRWALRRYWPYLGLTIVTWAVLLIVTAISVVSIIAGFIALGMLYDGLLLDIIDRPLRDETTNFISLLGTGLLVLFIFALCAVWALAPSIYLYARWLAAPAALVEEELGPFGSLGRSWRLSRKHSRRVIGYVLLLLAVMTLVMYIPATLFQWVLFVLLPPFSSLGLARGISGSISALFSIIGTPFYIGAVVLLYYDLRIRSENYDLALRVADLEEQVAQDTDQDMP